MKRVSVKLPNLGVAISFALVLTLGLAEPASAAGFTDFFNNILTEVNNVRRPLSLIAIILVGLAAVFNMFDFRVAGRVIVGIIIIWSAAELLDLITG